MVKAVATVVGPRSQTVHFIPKRRYPERFHDALCGRIAPRDGWQETSMRDKKVCGVCERQITV